MCDLDDFGVPAVLEAADTVTCRCGGALETAYLLGTEANADHIRRALRQFDRTERWTDVHV